VSNSEPTYEYVKGVGWVASYDEIVTLACGTVVRVEHRPPDRGERYFYSRPGHALVITASQKWAWADVAGSHENHYKGLIKDGYVFVVVKKL
jgi:hypothetical protein